MDDTPERFAYRCLPLAMANAHGWELLSPCGFEASWNGGSDASAVEILLDPGVAVDRAPVSLFGQGTITFHVEAIVQTEPGWDLWVGGSPNHAKDGIAPLGGVIETDWSPYSFTMNWRFTRPGHRIRFEKDEPFCFFFPVQRGVLENVEPLIRPIEEAPQIKAAFVEWSRSRDAFQTWVKEANPPRPGDHWQKLYYRGLDPYGKVAVPDHRSKLRLAHPAVSPLVITDECPASAAPPTKLAKALEPGSAAATLAAGAPAVIKNAGLALRQRDWILQTAERQRLLSPSAGELHSVSDVSSEEFRDHFYAPGRAVLIEGEMAGWPVLTRWTRDYLKHTIGNAPVEFQGGREDSDHFELYKDNFKQEMPFDRLLEKIDQYGGNDAYITAYNNGRNAKTFEKLQDELGHFDKFLTRGPGMMWIGPEGTFTPLHFDLTNNLLAQVVGRKRLLIAPPSETSNLYNHVHVFSQVHDITDPAQLQRYPLAANARFFEVEIGPGDLLFIPVGWWHQVRASEFSITLTYTNFLWANDAYASFPTA
jgi:hypothetical protein